MALDILYIGIKVSRKSVNCPGQAKCVATPSNHGVTTNMPRQNKRDISFIYLQVHEDFFTSTRSIGNRLNEIDSSRYCYIET